MSYEIKPMIMVPCINCGRLLVAPGICQQCKPEQAKEFIETTKVKMDGLLKEMARRLMNQK